MSSVCLAVAFMGRKIIKIIKIIKKGKIRIFHEKLPLVFAKAQTFDFTSLRQGAIFNQ